MTIKVVLPEVIDRELGEFMERWGSTHPYDVRGRKGKG